MNKIDDVLSKILESIMVVTLLITIIVTFLQVVFRYLLGISFPWSQEFLMMSFVYSIFAGAAYLASTHEHLVVDLFDKLNPKIDTLLSIMECIIAIFVLVVFVYYGVDLVQSNLISGQTLSSLPIQRAYLYMSVPIFSTFMIYFYVRRLYKVCFGLV